MHLMLPQTSNTGARRENIPETKDFEKLVSSRHYKFTIMPNNIMPDLFLHTEAKKLQFAIGYEWKIPFLASKKGSHFAGKYGLIKGTDYSSKATFVTVRV